MKIETKVSLTNEEKESLSVLCRISCFNIDSCKDCPFCEKPSLSCLLIGIQNNCKTVLKNTEVG